VPVRYALLVIVTVYGNYVVIVVVTVFTVLHYVTLTTTDAIVFIAAALRCVVYFGITR